MHPSTVGAALGAVRNTNEGGALVGPSRRALGEGTPTESVQVWVQRCADRGPQMGLGSKAPDEETVAQYQAPELTNRILVVEDHPSVQKILKRLFQAEGFAVEGHMHGRAGLDSFHAELPSAAILDLHLPKLSGQRLCKEMKAMAPSIPIIFSPHPVRLLTK
jgi:Response regulator receiver domain